MLELTNLASLNTVSPFLVFFIKMNHSDIL
jgi:hypothetical protein